jgi:hypothetical protein
MVRTIIGMQHDPVLADAARGTTRRDRPMESSGIAVAHDGAGAPVVVAMQNGRELGFLIAAAPEEFLAAATLRGALLAQRGNPEWDEHETGQLPQAQLAAWTRLPAPVSMTTWQDFRSGMRADAHLVWVFVLLLLTAETLARRRSRKRQPEVYVNAA